MEKRETVFAMNNCEYCPDLDLTFGTPNCPEGATSRLKARQGKETSGTQTKKRVIALRAGLFTNTGMLRLLLYEY